jgi:hypothetical protein
LKRKKELFSVLFKEYFSFQYFLDEKWYFYYNEKHYGIALDSLHSSIQNKQLNTKQKR